MTDDLELLSDFSTADKIGAFTYYSDGFNPDVEEVLKVFPLPVKFTFSDANTAETYTDQIKDAVSEYNTTHAGIKRIYTCLENEEEEENENEDSVKLLSETKGFSMKKYLKNFRIEKDSPKKKQAFSEISDYLDFCSEDDFQLIDDSPCESVDGVFKDGYLSEIKVYVGSECVLTYKVDPDNAEDLYDLVPIILPCLDQYSEKINQIQSINDMKAEILEKEGNYDELLFFYYHFYNDKNAFRFLKKLAKTSQLYKGLLACYYNGYCWSDFKNLKLVTKLMYPRNTIKF